MDIEAVNSTFEHSKDIIIPPEATHERQLHEVLEDLSLHGYAVIVGPSRAGKTTFLRHSLPATLQENGYEDPLLLDCMTALSQEAVPELLMHETTVILDEATRMAEDPTFRHALKERIAAKYPTVICATLFDSNVGATELHMLLAELPIGEDADVMVDFPIAMTQKDATALIAKILPDTSTNLILELTRLTTQPYLIRLILNEVRKNGQANLNSSVQDVLQNNAVSTSLQPEARSIWQKITSDPYPRWLIAQDQDNEEIQ